MQSWRKRENRRQSLLQQLSSANFVSNICQWCRLLWTFWKQTSRLPSPEDCAHSVTTANSLGKCQIFNKRDYSSCENNLAALLAAFSTSSAAHLFTKAPPENGRPTQNYSVHSAPLPEKLYKILMIWKYKCEFVFYWKSLAKLNCGGVQEKRNVFNSQALFNERVKKLFIYKFAHMCCILYLWKFAHFSLSSGILTFIHWPGTFFRIHLSVEKLTFPILNFFLSGDMTNNF